MDAWMLILVIFGALTIAAIGAGWAQWLEHRGRMQAMEVIKAALQAGKDAPPQVYDQLVKTGAQKAPWSEVVVFTALSFGFWIAFAQTDGPQRTAFLIVAATMTVTALGCLALVLLRPGARRDRDAAE